MPKAYLVTQANVVVSKIVSEDPEALTSIKAAYSDPVFEIKEFDDPNDPEFINSNGILGILAGAEAAPIEAAPVIAPFVPKEEAPNV